MSRLSFALAGSMAIATATVGTGVTPQLAKAQDAGAWSALEEQDLRLAEIAERLMHANASLCDRQMPITGLLLHSADQYRANGSARGRFAESELAIAAVLPHSPASKAGLLRDDGIVAINGEATSTLGTSDESHLREAAFEILADQAPSEPITLTVSRDGERRDVILDPLAGCRSLVEILAGDGEQARSDGRVVQIGAGLATALDDEQLAIVVAHELAHNILHHRERKEAAGITNGLFAEVGRNQQVNRMAEVEADRLSVHLLANAGYDPAAIVRFWNSPEGCHVGGGILPSLIYPSQSARADLVAREIAMYLPAGRGPSWPGHLLTMRDRAF
ncbi:M48 family metallopeptidase [Aurantiacibacter spongiae]|uniref:PDZ domain-containing protein n=1 Tax=Aurantiacibacter spongiae TaxID=2488860 RepID=A0A3N5D6X7_9SPHN|nr:M48 family metallopeptidase [Aurantiacibacter spongiae]RPF70238.1 PDZ domain-containing protein [Aurantiacibacter spongiae]